MHVRQAEVQLGSCIPWIADAMTNELEHALGDMPNSEFIIDPDGRVVARVGRGTTRRHCGRTWND